MATISVMVFGSIEAALSGDHSEGLHLGTAHTESELITIENKPHAPNCVIVYFHNRRLLPGGRDEALHILNSNKPPVIALPPSQNYL